MDGYVENDKQREDVSVGDLSDRILRNSECSSEVGSLSTERARAADSVERFRAIATTRHRPQSHRPINLLTSESANCYTNYRDVSPSARSSESLRGTCRTSASLRPSHYLFRKIHAARQRGSMDRLNAAE